MHVEWHGQSAFALTAPEARVFIDPFGDIGDRRRARHPLRLPADRGRRGRPPARHPRAPRPQRRRGDRRRAGDPALHGGQTRVADRRGRWRSPPSTMRRRAPSAAPIRSSPSSWTGCDLPTSATSARASCARSRPRRSARSTWIFLPVGGGPTIGAPPRRRSSSASTRAGSCRCTTRRRAPASSRAEEAFVGRYRRGWRGCETPGFETADLGTAGGPIAVVPAAP